MSFEPRKFKEIFDDMQDRTTTLTDFQVGSVTRTLFETFSYELALMYEKMNLVYLSAFIDSATGFDLDRVVAVLGIQRSLPDFSVGLVSFERDLGQEDIIVPIGTLVATEDTPENPKKVYQTIEQVVIASNEASADAKVQAIQTGEEQDTLQGTVIVMPRPIPGIKGVSNSDPIRLIGRRKETDEELRERAKNFLIASGKANILAIENSVLSLPRVLDVKVNERFHYAEGEVEISRMTVSSAAILLKGTLLAFEDSESNKWLYRLIDNVSFQKSAPTAKGFIRALKKGSLSELDELALLEFDDPSLQTEYAISQHDPIVRGDFGIVEVFVDALDFDEPFEAGRTESLREVVSEEIDKVRAAGILVLVEEARKIEVDAVIRISLSPNMNLNEEERLQFEQEIQFQIQDFFLKLKLGETFAFSQMIKTVISIEGVENLENFWLQTIIDSGEQESALEFEFSNNKITAEEYERFSARYVCVASEEKDLPIHFEFQAVNITDQLEGFLSGIQAYFNGKNVGDEILISELEQAVDEVLTQDLSASLVSGSFKVFPESWCERPMLVEEDGDQLIKTSFVEKPVLGAYIFAYENKLMMTGAIQLDLPVNTPAEKRATIYEEARQILETYLSSLKSEEEFLFEDLTRLIEEHDQIHAAGIDHEDFQARIALDLQTDRVTEDAIAVEPFEKLFAEFLLISAGQETIELSVDQIDILLSLTSAQMVNQQTFVDDLRASISHVVSTYLNSFSSGDDVIYEQLKTALEGLIQTASYQITTLDISSLSTDQRTQQGSITAANDFHVRSVEIPRMSIFDSTALTITVQQI